MAAYFIAFAICDLKPVTCDLKPAIQIHRGPRSVIGVRDLSPHTTER
jgi:hypothetical protein